MGSFVLDLYTDTNGRYNSKGVTIHRDATISFVFEHDKWKITTENSTAPMIDTWGKHSEFINHQFIPGSSSPEFEVHRAVNFYYNHSYNIPKYHYSLGIRVIASSLKHPEYLGLFHYSYTQNAFIEIFNDNRTNHGRLFGTVFHELGHWVQYSLKGGSAKSMSETEKLIMESWASFVGWHLGELYYSRQGLSFTPEYDITGNSKQKWLPDLHDYYTPLFVDLRDDYNQCVDFEDKIKNISFSALCDIAKNSSSWASCRNLIRSNLTGRYTGDEIDEFLAPYDGYVYPGEIRVYPNPVTTTLNIKLGSEIYDDATIEIYTSASQKIYSTSRSNLWPGNIITINLSSLTPGFYTLKFKYYGFSGYFTGEVTAKFIKS